MAQVTLQSNPIHTNGELPEVGSAASDFSLTDPKLEEISLDAFKGHKLVLNIVPSIDTGICAKSARKFNERATALENTKVLTISRDLPFAMSRFCAAEGIENVVMLSDFRSDFGPTYGVELVDGPMKGLLARAIVVLDASHQIVYTELVPEIAQEPDYDKAVEALQQA
tara:strand:+ start:34 stop:537 length:504 start_codon:yes stop_codon:yes gene_type:complete